MKLYTIGEVSKLHDISVKTLRHYDKIGLLKPAHINTQNGYRYYTYNQFIVIDRIKLFKHWNISLTKLKELIYNQDESYFEDFYKNKIDELSKEMQSLEKSKRTLEKFRDHYLYHKAAMLNTHVYVRYMQERRYISLPYDHSIDKEANRIAFRRFVTSPMFEEVTIVNPYGYTLDWDNLKNDAISINRVFVSFDSLKEVSDKYIFKAPKGIYICYSSKILSNKSTLAPLIDYLEKHQLSPQLILAEEFTPSWVIDIEDCPYEIQILCEAGS